MAAGRRAVCLVLQVLLGRSIREESATPTSGAAVWLSVPMPPWNQASGLVTTRRSASHETDAILASHVRRRGDVGRWRRRWCHWVLPTPNITLDARDAAAARTRHRAFVYGPRARQRYSPYERPITSSMISSLPAPIRFRRRSRQDRSIPYSFIYPFPPWIWMHSSATSTAIRAE